MEHEDLLREAERGAEEILARERRERMVQQAVSRLRRRTSMSLWQRLADKLPFVIVWKKRNP